LALLFQAMKSCMKHKTLEYLQDSVISNPQRQQSNILWKEKEIKLESGSVSHKHEPWWQFCPREEEGRWICRRRKAVHTDHGWSIPFQWLCSTWPSRSCGRTSTALRHPSAHLLDSQMERNIIETEPWSALVLIQESRQNSPLLPSSDASSVGDGSLRLRNVCNHWSHNQLITSQSVDPPCASANFTTASSARRLSAALPKPFVPAGRGLCSSQKKEGGELQRLKQSSVWTDKMHSQKRKSQ
jgi:hypothetical protein